MLNENDFEVDDVMTDESSHDVMIECDDYVADKSVVRPDTCAQWWQSCGK